MNMCVYFHQMLSVSFTVPAQSKTCKYLFESKYVSLKVRA